jgi:protein-S-isoprenylcysteine O-methyltransferase Ste14
MRASLIVLLIVVWLLRVIEFYWLPRHKKSGTVHAPWTLVLLGWGYAAVVACSIVEFITLHRPVHFSIAVLGWGIVFLRVPVKFWAARTLDRYWSPQIEIRNDHQLITSGPYRYIRHPVYFAAILDMVAVPLITGAYYTLATMSLALLVAILCRMYIEEQVLLRKFGASYEQYQRETFALVPVRKELISVVIRTLRLRQMGEQS